MRNELAQQPELVLTQSASVAHMQSAGGGASTHSHSWQPFGSVLKPNSHSRSQTMSGQVGAQLAPPQSCSHDSSPVAGSHLHIVGTHMPSTTLHSSPSAQLFFLHPGGL